MRFELSVALKYLIPKKRQLSVSVISLVSILVISLVVWLVVVFLSVTEGIEKKWIEELVAINAPLRMTPKEAYYHSYYYQIDSLSQDSNYTNKSIGEKLASASVDPYNPQFDSELPNDFPVPDKHDDGSLKDLVKEGWQTISNIPSFQLTPREYEVAFGNLRLQLLHNANPPLLPLNVKESALNQISYIASFDGENQQLRSMLLPLNHEDYTNLLVNLEHKRENNHSTFQQRVAPFFKHLQIRSLQTAKEGWQLPKSLYPKEGSVAAVAIKQQDKIIKIFIPQDVQGISWILDQLATYGFESISGQLQFGENSFSFLAKNSVDLSYLPPLFIVGQSEFPAKFLDDSLLSAKKLTDLRFEIDTHIQQLPLRGKISYRGLSIKEIIAKNDEEEIPYWFFENKENKVLIPSRNALGDGIILPKSYRDNGAHLGDIGTVGFSKESTSSFQEMRLPIYVAGFYDPGLMPTGNRVVLADPEFTSALRSNYNLPSDGILGNGISIWLPKLKEAPKAKQAIQKNLQEKGLDKYWKVESFADYELTQPIFQQLQSDKTLFTLIAVIILIVACSNIISMLILLVNDKRKEVGILQSMGASKFRIGLIFGICGLITGLFSSLVGTVAAIFTLKNLQSLVSILNFLQGHEAFHQAFYGSELPSALSFDALGFVMIATVAISILAGVIPAIKAARIHPSQILRAE